MIVKISNSVIFAVQFLMIQLVLVCRIMLLDSDIQYYANNCIKVWGAKTIQPSGITFIVITLNLETAGYASLFTYLYPHNPDVHK